jgi:hypothetical protein
MLARERALEIALGEAAMHVHEEGGDNTGPRVIQYQAAAGGGTHWPWCDAFCDFCFQEAGRPLEELQESASVMTSYRDAKAKGWIVETPQRGDLVCFQWDTGDFDHIGFVIQPMPDGSIKTVEGNTSAMPGEGHAQGEGDGVFVKIRPRSVCGAFIRVPGNVADPQPKAGFDDWAKWVKGGKQGKRPDVPEKVPQAWWAKLADGIDAKHDPHPPGHVKSPAHAGAGH